MKVRELLCSDEMKLPLTYTRNDDFYEFLKEKFKNFKDKFETLNDEPLSKNLMVNKDTIFDTCDKVIKTLELYLSGKLFKCYNVFGELSNSNKKYLVGSTVNKKPDVYIPIKFLYKARTNNIGTLFEKKQMFHIPFQERRNVPNNRYSINGIPCLYLGSSVYICCKENNKENEISQLDLVRYEVKEGITYVDFSYFPDYLGRRLEKYGNSNVACEEVVAFFHNWPIIAASSTKVRERDKNFKPEYIIPSLLMQWISSSDEIDGIKYFSTKVSDDKTDNISLYQNYAFPIKEYKREGYSQKLLNKFKMTDVFSGDFKYESKSDIIEEKDLNDLLNHEKYNKDKETNEKILNLWKTNSKRIEISNVFHKFDNTDDRYHCISSFTTNITNNEKEKYYIDTNYGQVEYLLMMSETTDIEFTEISNKDNNDFSVITNQ